MLSRSIEDISPMHAFVIVEQYHISLRHFHELHVLHRDLVHVFEICIANITIVAVKHIGLVDLRGTVFESFSAINRLPVLTKLGRMRVDIAKPMRLSRDGVNQNWWLARRPSLKHFDLIVSPLTPLQIHGEIHLGINRRARQSLDRPHNTRPRKLRQIVHPPEERQLHHRIPNVAIVQLLHEFRLQIPKDLTSVRDEELPSLLGGLEAHERRGARSARSDEFVVHADEEVLATLLVDGLVDGGILIAVDGGSGRDRVEGIEAGVHADGFVELDEALLRFHEVEFAEDDGAVVDHFLFDFHGVFFDVGELSVDVVGCEADVGRFDGGCEFHLARLGLLLAFEDVGDLFSPNGEWCEG
mmetsp:Transcript_19967/g.43420  ORF Transcript_19967/g.43420 Transcript_19967/m.43420 type:complete len:356 (+) Transcript_19967:169-1236(+)